MILTLVDHEKYDHTNPSQGVLAEKVSDHVPLNGDLIKDGHTLSSFNVYRVESRVFRSLPPKNGEDSQFDQVYLLVSNVMEH